MNYCSLEDAWGKTDYITDQYKKYDKSQIKETFIEKPIEKHMINDHGITQKNLYNNHHLYSCDNLINHLNSCPSCRMKMRQQFSSKLVDKIQQLIIDNKDTILLILLALFALIFFNLLISIFRK